MAGRNLTILARQFSTSTTTQALIRPPVAVHGIDGRYASALYSAASKQKSLEAVEKDLVSVQAQIAKDPVLESFLFDPSINKKLKIDGLGGVADKLKLNPLSKNLLLAIAENNRYNLIPAVASSFSTIMAAHRGEVICEVTTAKALDGAMAKEIEGALAGFLKKGQKAQITYKVDPAIIGGVVVSIADKFCDMSMATKLTKYSELIKAAA